MIYVHKFIISGLKVNYSVIIDFLHIFSGYVRIPEDYTLEELYVLLALKCVTQLRILSTKEKVNRTRRLNVVIFVYIIL